MELPAPGVSHTQRTRLDLDAWELTQQLSPRATVRVAAVDAYGAVVNTYTGHQRITTAAAPERPWAVYLTNAEHRFTLLGFDLDAKTPQGATAAADEADTIADLLNGAGLQSVICQSGPSGGRHVWAALAEPVDADTVATIARLARHLCPTLDLSPLTNPATGCIRPPWAPHRDGDTSVVIAGDVDDLIHPTGTAAQVDDLAARLAQLVDADQTRTTARTSPLPLDDRSRLYLPGTRRALPASAAAALQEDAASGDASAILWRILIGAAAAHWHHADVAALVDTAPGLEHIRTERDRGHRRPRNVADATRTLRRQWDKAVRHVDGTDRQIGDDPTFDARAHAVAAHVDAIQTRADAARGRWTHGGGPSARRILDQLSVLALQAVQSTVEADIRRLALLTGLGRETARTALLKLAEDGWISQVSAADGPHAARWTIDPQSVIPRNAEQGRSQADPRPPGAGSAERTTLLTSLTTRLAAAAHDVFTLAPGYGILAGNIYSRLDTAHTAAAVATAHGLTLDQAQRIIGRLTTPGLIYGSADGWRRTEIDHRDRIAQHIGVDGRLSARARQYNIERELWAWWQAEHTWMTSHTRTDSTRRPGPTQLTLLPDYGATYGAHPRNANGDADYRAARAELEAIANGLTPAARAPQLAPRRRGTLPRLTTVPVPTSTRPIVLELDPGYCNHGVTTGARCTRCGGIASIAA